MSPRAKRKKNPRILIVTPEITYLPSGMGNMANSMNAKAGGLADVSAALVSSLFDLGADVHVALPHYRQMFSVDVSSLISKELRVYQSKLPKDRIHLAEDRIFYYRDEVYSGYQEENPRISLAFQREVINNIIPTVNPDLIHCNDWMTGLIPGMARRLDIPCLFTVHNIHTHNLMLSEAEDRGIDTAGFWRDLYYTAMPHNYEYARDNVPVDLLASGIFSAHFINTVSPTFLTEIVDGHHSFVNEHIRREVANKLHAGCAEGILNAPDPAFSPETDKQIATRYTPETAEDGKRTNKIAFQKEMGLTVDPDAPILFWPSRLDPIQKGCQLLAEILYAVVSKYWDKNLQIAFVANGAFQQPFHDIVDHHNFYGRVAVRNFNENLSHLGYAASDFMLMPSKFEPCGLPQMTSAIYGSLPIAHDTGGLHDTITHYTEDSDSGNGFLFENYNSEGLFWAIDEAMRFYDQPQEEKNRQITRIMRESSAQFNHGVTAEKYFDIYERMLQRPLIDPFAND